MAAIIRKLKVNMGNVYPRNLHQTAVDLIDKIEGTEFKLSSHRIGRGAIRHGDISISHPKKNQGPPYLADVVITFYNENTNEDPLDTGPPGDESVGKGKSNFKHRILPNYPTEAQLKNKAEA